MESQQEFECCPPFDPVPWDGQFVEWKDKKFVKEKIRTFFYMPLNFGAVMRRLLEKVDTSGAAFVDNLTLSDHTSMWNMDLYAAVDKEIDKADNVTLSGKYYAKVYEGPFSNTGKWTKDYESKVKELGLSRGKEYMWYTTCPKCAKKYGKNYTVIISSIQ